jgi:hypothetical protein
MNAKRKQKGFGEVANSARVSQNEVADASSERCDVRVDVKGRCGAGEGRGGGLGAGAGASGQGDRGAVALGHGGGGCGGSNGRGHVGGVAGVLAGHGDGVDAVDGRGDVDSGVIRLGVLGHDADEEREEEDDDLLEGAHVDGLVWCCGGVCDGVWCCATGADARKMIATAK